MSVSQASPRIEIALHAGVCYGVERALSMAYDAAHNADQPVHTLGPLIHNPRVVQELECEGVGLAGSVDDVDGGTVVIRAHGVVPQVIDAVRGRGMNVIDATCPYVKKVHAAAAKLVSQGYQLIVVGESGHPEVEGILGHAGGPAFVVSDVEDLDSIELSRRVGVVVQTTQTLDRLAQIVSALIPRVAEVNVINTICKATHERQASAADLAQRADVMVIVGGKNSGNTRRLAQICSQRCASTHHIEDDAEIEPAWFEGASLIGITTGASTPAAHIEQARAAIAKAVGL